MISLEEDKVYVANHVYYGENEKGTWEIIVVKVPGPRQPAIAISVQNSPSGINSSAAFRVDKIKSVEVRNHKNKNGSWTIGGNVLVKADISPIDTYEGLIENLQGRSAKPKKPKPQTVFKNMEDWFND